MSRARTSGTYVPPPSRGACPTGKVEFATRKQAKSWRRKMDGDPVGAYRCGECEWWHLGHKPGRVRNGEIDKADWLRAKGIL